MLIQEVSLFTVDSLGNHVIFGLCFLFFSKYVSLTWLFVYILCDPKI